MTTTTSQVPAWLNIEALGLPADAIATIRETNVELRGIVARLDVLLAEAAKADNAVEDVYRVHDLQDDLRDMLGRYTGREELWNLLALMQSMGEVITGSSGVMEPWLSKLRGEMCLTADWPEDRTGTAPESPASNLRDELAK